MGCRCGYSICSVCSNKAITEDDFCDHIKYYKGSTFNGLPVFEDNRDIEFFEDSFVVQGADPEAKILERVASKGGLIKKHATYNKNNLAYIVNELNQRSTLNRIETFSDKLKNLPWN